MQKLYYNGDIITMEQQLYTQAVLIQNGHIQATGALDTLKEQAEKDVECIDLQGHCMMPAFIDAHSHFSAYANAQLQVPLEEARNFSEIAAKLQAFQRNCKPGEWIIAKGYDHNLLEEKRQPDATFLDEIMPDNPVVIQHKSGHMGVFNSKALENLNVTPETEAPDGGIIGKENGKLNGYMEENAFLTYLRKVPMPSMEDILNAYRIVQQKYASYGITTVQEGMMVNQMAPMYQALIQSGLLELDVIGYVDIQDCNVLMQQLKDYIKKSKDHFKIGGYKIFLDGSPQGRTAWMLQPYEGAADG